MAINVQFLIDDSVKFYNNIFLMNLCGIFLDRSF